MKRNLLIAMRDYTVAVLITLPGFILSCRLLTWYVPRMMPMHEVMQATLPSHLVKMLDVWQVGHRFLPWSALLLLLCFTVFEVAVRAKHKAGIRQVVLMMVALFSVGFCTLTAWSVVDAYDQNNLRVFHKHFREQWMNGEQPPAGDSLKAAPVE